MHIDFGCLAHGCAHNIRLCFDDSDRLASWRLVDGETHSLQRLYFFKLLGIQNADMDDLLKDGIVLVLESLAGGTFIYVTFFEVLAQERANDHSNLIQLGAIVVGFLVISGLQVNESLGEKASVLAEYSKKTNPFSASKTQLAQQQ